MIIIGVCLVWLFFVWLFNLGDTTPAYWYYKDKYGRTRKYRWL